MTPDLTIKIAQEYPPELLIKWKSMLDFSDITVPSIPAKFHNKAVILFEKAEKAIKSISDSPKHLIQSIIPFFRRNYEDFLECEEITMEHFPLTIAHGELGKVIHKYESDLMGNHLWEHDLVNLWKINDKFYLI